MPPSSERQGAAPVSDRSSLREIGRLFFVLGVTAFGGPAAHIALMEDAVVSKRRWLSAERFLDLIGVTHLIPGPNSTEMAMHIGYERGAWRGLCVAGAAFILPAALLTGALAWVYLRFGSVPAAEPLLLGIRPVILVVIGIAAWRLGKKALKGWQTWVVAAGVVGVAAAGVNEVVALIGGGLIGALWLRAGRPTPGAAGVLGVLTFLGSAAVSAQTTAAVTIGQVSLLKLGLFFLRVGAVLYGSGYLLIAFLEGDVVHRYGWLTEQVLLDAIAIGQFTPGPVLTTATFVGALVAGLPGAVVATVAIFLPSVAFVRIANPLATKLRASPWLSAFLDAVNASALGLMAFVTLRLAGSALTGWVGWALGAGALILALRFKVSAVWLVVVGAAVSFLINILG